MPSRSLTLLNERSYPDHRDGDKTRMRKVAANYRKILERLRDLQQNRELFTNKKLYFDLLSKLQTELHNVKPYFQSYLHFANTTENPEIVWLFKYGLDHIKFWFQGFGMSSNRYKDYAPTLRAFRIAQRLFPNTDMTLYRVVAVNDARRAQSLRTMKTGIKALQSWTLDFKTAVRFYQSQYATGETLVVDASGMGYQDKTQQHDFIVVKAHLPAAYILWTPSTSDRLSRYDMHAIDSKLYTSYGRVRGQVSEVLDAYREQREIIVYIPQNSAIAIQGVMPLHIRNEISSEEFQ